MEILNRFLKYVKINTQSDPDSEKVNPSAERETAFAKLLKEEFTAAGLQNVRCDEHAYVYGFLPATKGYENAPAVGFIAHMDTSPDFSGENVQPVIHENYDGGDLPLKGRVLSPKQFPDLTLLKGRTLITADGTTLLGADDKAGIAEILAVMEKIVKENIPHGKLAVCVTPDEEIGAGADSFDVASFGCDFAYTVDGGTEGEIVYENFNAATASFEITGVNIHPGSAKGIMRNASLIAMEINSMLPAADIPASTEGYEGFFHLCDMTGTVEKATLTYIVRDHSASVFDARLAMLRHIAQTVSEKYPTAVIKLKISEQYRNMEEMVKLHPQAVEIAKEAIISCGLEPLTEPIRGGTDGARLSFMGLPCPNLGTGGYAYHGPYEHISLEGMEKSAEIILSIISLAAKSEKQN